MTNTAITGIAGACGCFFGLSLLYGVVASVERDWFVTGVSGAVFLASFLTFGWAMGKADERDA